jgi:hypothetical protein
LGQRGWGQILLLNAGIDGHGWRSDDFFCFATIGSIHESGATSGTKTRPDRTLRPAIGAESGHVCHPLEDQVFAPSIGGQPNSITLE